MFKVVLLRRSSCGIRTPVHGRLRYRNVTVITRTHIPDHSANQRQPFVIPPKNSSRTLAREKCHPPPDVKLRSIEGGLSIPPTDRPLPTPGQPLNPDPNPPTPSAHREQRNWPPDWVLQPRPASTVASCTDSSPSLSSTLLSHPTIDIPRPETNRKRSPRCCRHQQPGTSPERPPRPPSSPPPPPHPASPRQRRRQQQYN